MRALIQRVSQASVNVEGAQVGACGQGMLILVCAMRGDTRAAADKLAAKVSKLRIFKDENDKMNLSVRDIGGAALAISQFTLAADTKGNRPGFSTASDPETGRDLYEAFVEALIKAGVPTEKGIFGADMQLSLINDGPVTIWLDTDA